MNPPAIERAVQTTPPIISAATIPEVPESPTEVSMIDAKHICSYLDEVKNKNKI